MSDFISSNKARQNILAKLNKVLDGADPSKLPTETPFDYPAKSQDEMMAQFVGQLQANHAEVVDVTRESLASEISRQLQQRHITSLMYGAQGQYSPLFDSRLASDIQLMDYAGDIETCKEQLFFDTPAGITAARYGIAATGTLVLWPDANEPRSLSLVPPLHLVILDKTQLFRDFGALMAEQQWHRKLPTNIVLVSGPSKTADIQQTLAYGAHGPKELVVLLLDDQV